MSRGQISGEGKSKICMKRKEKKLSQQGLAELCGLNKNTIISWDYGVRPSGANLEKLAEVLECEQIDLI